MREHPYKGGTLSTKEQRYITQLFQRVIDKRTQGIWGKEAAGFLTGEKFQVIEQDDGTLTITSPYEIATDLQDWEFLAKRCARGEIRETGFIQTTITRVQLKIRNVDPTTQVELIPSPTEDMKSGKTITVDNPLPLAKLAWHPTT